MKTVRGHSLLSLSSLLTLIIAAGCITSSPTLTEPTSRLDPPAPYPAPTQPALPTSYSLPLFTPTQPPLPTGYSVPGPIPTQTGIMSILPSGAEPLYQQAWSMSRTCGWPSVTFIPYRLSDGHLSLLAARQEGEAYTLYWDWRQEKIGPKLWRDVRPILQPPSWTEFPFLGLDDNGQWWIGVTRGCETLSLLALLPISDPGHLFLDISQFNFNPNAPLDFWVVENDVLTLYHWIGNKAVRQWSFKGAPRDAVTPWYWDVTGDGAPELILMWWWKRYSQEWRNAVDLYQIFQPDGDGYKLVGEVEPGLQLTSANGDGIPEFLKPQPADAPKMWEVYKWNGERFEWGEPLTPPVAPTPKVPDLQTLPPLPMNLYFSRGGQFWVWPHEGGLLRSTTEIPVSPTPNKCGDAPAGQQVLSWSPDCRFALVNIPGQIEGSSYGILNAESGQVKEVPGSFIYVRGNSTFAWDPQSRFIVHASADGPEGLFRIDLDSGAEDILLRLSSFGLGGVDRRFFGAVGPTVFQDASVGVSVQGVEPYLYPPFGIYRVTLDHRLSLLAAIPPLEKPADLDGPAYYGTLAWSPDGSMFLYHAPRSGYQEPPYSTLLLGMADGSVVWDLNSILGDSQEFQWADK